MSGNRYEEFHVACGMTESLRLEAVKGGIGPTQAWSGRQPFALIGREGNAELHLDDEAISRRHVYLQVVDGRLYGIDLGSRTGARWRGEPWRGGWLAPEDVLGVGPYEVRIAGGEMDGGHDSLPPKDSPGPVSSRYRGRPGLPGVSLEVSGPAGAAAQWRMNRVLVCVGTAPACRLKLLDVGIAPFHCSLIRTPGGVWVVDLLGEQGTFLNRCFVRAARLEHGDVLQIGRASIRILLDDALQDERARALPPPLATSAQLSLPGGFHPLNPAPGAGSNLPMPMYSAGSTAHYDPAIAAPVSPFETMQQQMFDQFHQLMMGMLQAFGAMHREQMSVVRKDLERLEQITRELQDLQSKPIAAPMPNGRSEPEPSSSSESSDVAGMSTTDHPITESGLDRDPSRTAGPRTAPPAHAPRPDPNKGPNATQGLDPTDIVRRIHVLQTERQGHWQRIVGVLFGAP